MDYNKLNMIDKINKIKFDLKKSHERCFQYRKKILDISQEVTALHGGGALSVLEIVDFIYHGLIYSENSEDKDNTFIMSKGHGCMAQYVVLNKLGILSDKDLDSYCKPEGILGCHPDYGNPGIEASTGSLGHGMGIAVGMAHFEKINNSNNKIFVVISDGELQEGSTWEAMMMAANLNLDNLICFLDHNGSQSFGHTIETHPKFYPIKDKVTAFNWSCETVNGHDVGALTDIYNLNNNFKKPHMFICDTIKGKGVSFMENKPIWHYRSPSNEEYIKAVKELELVLQ